MLLDTAQRDAAHIQALEQQHEVGVYPKRPLAMVRGQGAHLWDANDQRYIDCMGGQGSANLGHCHPAVVAAIQAQAGELLSCTETLPNNQRAAYLEALAQAVPFPARFYLCNSGAEAIEAGLKFARLLTGRTQIIAARRGFHGRTLGALSATWEPKYRQPFAPLLPDVTHVPYDNPAALAAAMSTQTAAVLLEPIQGEGGVRVPAPGYLAAVRELCDQHGALLLADEVQTGFGRTGTLFAIEQAGVVPDMLLLAKSIAGGLPMGALALHARHGTLPMGTHGSTFGGNPLLCAAAHAALGALLAEELPRQAAEKGAWLHERLAAAGLSQVREVRGRGLLVGIELKSRVQPVLVALLNERILALPAGPNVLRLLPPLVISYDDLHTLTDVLTTILR